MMASFSNSDYELEKLMERWNLVSPDFEIGHNLPIKNSEISEESVVINLTPEETVIGQSLLSNVANSLAEFTSLCRSKINPDEWDLFDKQLPTSCATLVKNILDEQQAVKSRMDLNRFSGHPSPDILLASNIGYSTDKADFITAPMREFLLYNSGKEVYNESQRSRLHDCELQYCRLKGNTSPDPNYCLAEFARRPMRPETPGPAVWSTPEGQGVSTNQPEGAAPDKYVSLGARPKKFRSRYWQKKRLLKAD